MHPIERLRYVARAGGAPAEPLVREAAGALAAFAGDSNELLTACRQLLRRHPGCGPLVWLAARMITGADPVREARDAVKAITADRTADELGAALPADSRILVIGTSDHVARAVLSRPDVETMVVDAAGDGFELLSELQRRDLNCVDVPDWGVGAAVAACDLVLVEANAAGPDGLLARSGSRAAVAVGHDIGIDVWAVAGVGRFLPVRMWQAMLELPVTTEPWLSDVEIVPLVGVDSICGPTGLLPVAEAVAASDCPDATGLFR